MTSEQHIDPPSGALHRPGRGWRCTDDGEEWPCRIFKRRMWTWYRDDRRRLAGIMAIHRDNAMAGMPNLTREQAQARFVGWVEGPPSRHPDAPPVRHRTRRI
ncbi:hypothetical protein ACIBF5_11635 [Micromonospora sp. NPDC050417]|uniref:hypothetical protein n=1 Tax=Micromonospora sp. NPDC050417 TaxID=3364280 RepID=UPI003787D6DB